MLSSGVSPNLYCFHCNLGICISILMVVGCFMVLVIVVLHAVRVEWGVIIEPAAIARFSSIERVRVLRPIF